HKVSAIISKGHPINGKHMGDNSFYLPVLLRLPEFQMRITSATYQYFPVRKVGKGKYGVSMAIQSKQGFPILQIEYHHTMVARTYRQVLLRPVHRKNPNVFVAYLDMPKDRFFLYVHDHDHSATCTY